jgi:hypothetical protein
LSSVLTTFGTFLGFVAGYTLTLNFVSSDMAGDVAWFG